MIRSFFFPGFAPAACLLVLTAACGDDTGPGGSGGATSASTQSGPATSTGASTSSSGQGGMSQGGGGQGGGGMASPECDMPRGCVLVDDCCTCAAIPAGEMPPPCDDVLCLVPKCTELGNSMAVVACEAHRCVASFNCDRDQVVCLAPEPLCPPGETASVTGGCWGPCVPATECSYVAACDQCDQASQVCVHISVGPVERLHCVALPPECGGTPSCACMGASVCGGIPCSEGSGEIVCATQ
jgi:hypothetical protein